MITNKDIRVENNKLVINGTPHEIGADTSELEAEVDALAETVGDSTDGLVKDVNELSETVGDNTGGLVKDVNDIEAILTALGTSNFIAWNYSATDAELSGFTKNRLLIGRSDYDNTGYAYIGALIGETVIDIQNTAAPGSSTSKPNIQKVSSTGWKIGKMSGQGGNFVIAEIITSEALIPASPINHYVIDGEAVNIPNAIYLLITNVRNGDPGDDDTFCVTLHTVNNLHARIAGTENCTYTISGDNLNITSISDSDEPIDVYTIKLA